jgi:polyisoprenoid-binding protein YceI
MIRRVAVLALFALLASPLASFAAEYKVDKAHTTVSFKIRHLFTNVAGRFDDFDGSVVFDPAAFADATVSGTIQVASINTNNEKRDTHLRSADFFDAEKYPTITFKSTKITDIDDAKKSAKLHGNLTMHGVEKPIVLDVAYLGTGKDPWGNTRGGFSATTQLNRKDFGITWNETLESGGLLLGEEVEVEINFEGMLAN